MFQWFQLLFEARFESKLNSTNLEEFIQDMRSDRTGHYYISTRVDNFTRFEQSIDRQLDEHDIWNLSPGDLGILELGEP